MNTNPFNLLFDPTWTTWDGRKYKLSELTHQHLSNIIYFMTYINTRYSLGIMTAIRDELYNRFNGVMLPYVPCGEYKPEIDHLRERGWLVPTDKEKHFDIIVGREKIGTFVEK